MERDTTSRMGSAKERLRHARMGLAYRIGGAAMFAAGVAGSVVSAEGGSWISAGASIALGVAGERIMTDHADEHVELAKLYETSEQE